MMFIRWKKLLDKQLEGMKEEALHGSHALQKYGGCIACARHCLRLFLGVIKTMASIDKPPEVFGRYELAARSSGTFFGRVSSPTPSSAPSRNKVKSIREQEH